jgi:hypothetical protein
LIRYRSNAAIAFLLLLSFTAHAQSAQWRPVRGGILYGISGMALVGQDASGRATFLVVHDNKEADEGRAALISITGAQQPEYVPLTWPKDKLPKDLEGLTAVPGQRLHYMALASAGRVYHIRLNEARQAIEVLKVFDLPNVPPGSNFESLVLQQFGAQMLAAWVHRGEHDDPGVLYWGLINLSTDVITHVHSTRIVVPWGAENVRHVSDLKVDAAGVVYAASAADPGNDGPFSSAVYVAGAFQSAGGEFGFKPVPVFTRLWQFPYHKIEALELVPGAAGGIILGTDDENMGSSVYLDW